MPEVRENDHAPKKDEGINPLAHIGDVLNHIDRIMDSQAALIGELAKAVAYRSPDQLPPELTAAAKRLVDALREYRADKETWAAVERSGDQDGGIKS